MKETEAIKKHREWNGKIEITSKVSVSNRDELSLAYTPGVADACLAIKDDEKESFNLTGRNNYVAVITDGSAILGLGNIGPIAGMPVMEGKCALFKEYGNVNAFPLSINTNDSEEIIKTIKYLEGSFGGINLEDISAPRCFDIEKRLINELSIPVFHDDQHGTAIVMAAALLNALKLANKKIEEIKIVINGAGAAGISICKYLLDLGAKHIRVVDKNGIINDNDDFNNAQRELAKLLNINLIGTLADAIYSADVFIGVSVANVLTKEMVELMNDKPILFTCANPIPEISYEEAKDTKAFIIGTGSSKYPNQINNVLVFPGIFRGALDAKAKKITNEMMFAATKAIVDSVGVDELSVDYILPYAWDKKAHDRVAKYVYEEAIKTK